MLNFRTISEVMDRKAAAEARRQKLLARGDDRLATITGSLKKEEDIGTQVY